MRNVVRASARSDRTTTETHHRRLFVRASFKAMTRAIANTPAMVTDATEPVTGVTLLEVFLAASLVDLE
jgi:hypothetical protein